MASVGIFTQGKVDETGIRRLEAAHHLDATTDGSGSLARLLRIDPEHADVLLECCHTHILALHQGADDDATVGGLAALLLARDGHEVTTGKAVDTVDVEQMLHLRQWSAGTYAHVLQLGLDLVPHGIVDGQGPRLYHRLVILH